MRSSFLICAAVAGVGLVTGLSPLANAADPKSNGKKKGGGDSLAEDKVIGKQLQWEEKVMGADDKRGELDKILKAQAINKAATEKAEREKEKLAKEQAAKDAAAERDKKNKKGGEVALPTLSDEEPSGGKSDKSKSTEISPKLDTAAAAAPPPPSKPADDKFIDKLLKEDGGSKKKKTTASTGDNKELIDILAGEKKDKAGAAKAKSAKKDSVDALLLEADKPAAPAPKIKHETPEWAKPEIRAVPTAAPVVARPQPKRDDGIIHVVQGAASTSTSRTAAPPAPPRMAPPAPLVPAGRKQTGATARGGSGDWDDPFSDTPRKAAASRNVTARSNRAAAADFDEDEAPAARRGSAAKREPARSAASARSTRADREDSDSWDDPFTAGGNRKASPRREAPATKPAKSTGSDSPRPARGGAWKDPFTEAQGASSKRQTALTKREAAAGKRGAAVAAKSPKGAARSDDGAKWESAGRKTPSPALAEAGAGHARWGVIKKR